MKIVIYCQHVLGIGHFFRTLALCRALDRHDLILVTGGEPVEIDLPGHVREIRLPSLMMNANFQNLHDPSQQQSAEKIKADRRRRLWDLFQEEAPDLFLVELYPFGRKAFRFELDPVLEGIRSGALPACRTVSSVRDILVEKEKAEAHEKRALNTLNTFFDALLIHADPKVITLDRTFGPFSEIAIPTVYTGYVTDPMQVEERSAMRRRLELPANIKVVVVSVGGGKVGEPLLEAVAGLPPYLSCADKIIFEIFTGPFADEEIVAGLRKLSSVTFRIHRFSPDFQACLNAADLSISMAGYNTCMNILAAAIPALVLPFDQNREQGLRAGRLADMGAMDILQPRDLDPRRLAALIRSALAEKFRPYPAVDLDGARKTAQWIEQWMGGEEAREKKD